MLASGVQSIGPEPGSGNPVAIGGKTGRFAVTRLPSGFLSATAPLVQGTAATSASGIWYRPVFPPSAEQAATSGSRAPAEPVLDLHSPPCDLRMSCMK